MKRFVRAFLATMFVLACLFSEDMHDYHMVDSGEIIAVAQSDMA
jgi:hypothetical protein